MAMLPSPFATLPSDRSTPTSDSLPLPQTIDAITSDWLAAATGLPITASRVVDVIHGTSTKVRVAVKSGGALPETIIVKGGFEPHSPSMAEMYANEAHYYAHIAPLLPLPGPACWFAGSDPGSFQSLVVMEDLARSGVTWLAAQQPQAVADVARRLDVLADFHAASWSAPGAAPDPRFATLAGRFTDWSMVYVRRYLEPETWAHYCKLPRGAAVSVSLHDRAWMERAFIDFAAIERSGPRCVIHGDTHLGNLFVRPGGTPGFFDAQPAMANPVMEVAYHVTAALDLADRRAAEETLLTRYLDRLSAGGVAVPAWADAWRWYRQFIAYGYFIFLINETRFQTEAVNTAYAARFGAAMLDHDVKAMVGR